MCQDLNQTFDDNNRHAAAPPARSNVLEIGKACYIIFPLDNQRAKKTWFDASSVCLYHGGDLATDITPLYDNSDIEERLSSSQVTNYWIGLQQRPFVWIDRSGIRCFLLKIKCFVMMGHVKIARFMVNKGMRQWIISGHLEGNKVQKGRIAYL